MKTALLALVLLIGSASLFAQDPAFTAPLSASSTNCTALSSCLAFDPRGTAPYAYTAVGIAITGTWAATIQFEGTIDCTTWFAVSSADASTGTNSTSTTANGSWVANVNGYCSFRARVSAYTSGTATVTLRPAVQSYAPVNNPSFTGNVTIGASLPTGAPTGSLATGGCVYNPKYLADVRCWGAKGDGRRVIDGVMSSSVNPTFLTSATAAFVAADVGKTVSVRGAGVAGAFLTTTIASVTSSTVAVLTVGASTTVSAKAVIIATDDTAAIQAAINAAGDSVYFPSGHYVTLSPITFPNNGASPPTQTPIRMLGAGSGANGPWSSAALFPVGGTILDLRCSSGPACIDTRGMGTLELAGFSFVNGSGTTTAMFQTTNTVVWIHDNYWFHAEDKADSTNNQDGIICGGTDAGTNGGATSAFSGYFAKLEHNEFVLRQGVVLQTGCNGTLIRDNYWAFGSGSPDANHAAIYLHPSTGALVGTQIVGNGFEVQSYPVTILTTGAVRNTLIDGNGFYDDSGSTVNLVKFNTFAKYNIVRGAVDRGSTADYVDLDGTNKINQPTTGVDWNPLRPSSQWWKYTVTAIANGVSGCANAGGCWRSCATPADQNSGVCLNTNQAAALNQYVPLAATAPANTYVDQGRIRVATVTACTGATTINIQQIGDTIALGTYAWNFTYNLKTAPSNTNFYDTAAAAATKFTPGGGATMAVNNVTGVQVVTTGTNVDTIVAGCSFNLWAFQTTLP